MTALDGISSGRHRSPIGSVRDRDPWPSPPAEDGPRRPSVVDRAESRPRTVTWLPLALALTWMLGTFGAFWLTKLARQVENPDRLCVFVLAATALFACGYVAQMARRVPVVAATTHSTDRIRQVRRLVLASAVYYVIVSLTRLAQFGATGPQSVWASIEAPATGYVNKFDVYQQGVTSTGPWMTLLLPLGVLSAALVPLLVVHWQSLPGWLRLAGVVGTAMHLSFYLYIGTMKGLGDVVIMLAAGMLIARASTRHRRRARSRRRRALALLGGAFALLAIYMAFSHATRATEFGTTGEVVRVNPEVERAMGEPAAVGLAAIIGYPTHGYLGLSYNLQVPFEWSHGLGSAPSAALFAEQSFGVDLTEHPTYPDRTQHEKGWPARMYWATIYPWLASDLTFPGAALFMGLVGWLFAGSWRAAVSSRRVVPTLIFAQLCILIVYVPANNQLGMAPESIVGMATLLVLYALQSPADGRQSQRRKNRPRGSA
ncbi:hypothetical protein OOJ91_29725 [Micromonospora lupini]|uniref:hypothetical protein n=1 Tax=Micromonospora lupini TaxID=285679 RepID=UPI002252FE08|nr:hypothetical protein [Micromonospora lupini]MCX5070033.1 hypothetical protein [Micromonospora lupini]